MKSLSELFQSCSFILSSSDAAHVIKPFYKVVFFCGGVGDLIPKLCVSKHKLVLTVRGECNIKQRGSMFKVKSILLTFALAQRYHIPFVISAVTAKQNQPAQ